MGRGSTERAAPTLPRLPDGRAGTNTALTGALLVARRATPALDLAPPLLRRDPLLDRLTVRTRRTPRPPDAERVAQRRDQPLDGQLAVPELTAFVLGHGADGRAGAREHALLLRVRQGRRLLDVEERLDAGLRLLGVLASRPARPGRAEADLRACDRDAARDLDPVGTRLARDGVNSGDGGCRLVRVGVDLIEIDRVRRTLRRYEDFRSRCFTEAERAYCDSKPNPPQHYAGRFAAKEAVGKAIGSGVYFTWKEIEIRGRPKPGVFLSGRTAAWAEKVGAGKTISRYQKDQIVFAQGDVADRVFYIQKGRVKVVVLSDRGKEAVIGILEPGQFFGEGCLNGNALRIATATALEDCVITVITKAAMVAALHDEPNFSELFVAYLLTRNSRIEEDLIDQLFNSSEKRLARLLLLLANFGKEGSPIPIDPAISQETLAEMIGTTRSRVSHFMNKFRKLGFISYNGNIEVHVSLLNAVLYEKPQIQRDH